MFLAIAGLGFFLPGLILTLLFGALLRVRRGEVRTHERILRTPTTPIARISGAGVFEIVGRALPSEQGTVRSPLSGREAFIHNLTVSRTYRHEVRVLHQEVDRRAFLVDDGSGERARVLPLGGALIARTRRYGEGGVHAAVVIGDLPSEPAALTAEGVAWLAARTGCSPREVQIDERTIQAGDMVYVLGPAERGPRDASGRSEVVFRHVDEEGGKLLVSNCTEGELAAVLGVRRTARRILFRVALGVMLFGLALGAVGLARLLG
ncbi:MAG: hypothetical protein IT373_34470 [Polyangiaceae bacterium]|nr:hypothetical protein [Polyangiaceae bacterium]